MNTNEVWFDVEGEHRRIYATRKLESGKWVAYLDRNTVLEFKGWPFEIPETLKAEDVRTISVMAGAKGVYMIQTNGGGMWAGYLLRRGYLTEEKNIIPETSEEAQQIDTTTVIIEAIKTDGTQTRETVTNSFAKAKTWGGKLLEKCGMKPRNKRFPRVSRNGKRRVAEMWRGWYELSMMKGFGGEKIDCFQHYRKELLTFGITDPEHFKAVIDNARK